MIKTRLIRLLADAQKYIYLQVLFDWLALFCQTAIIFSAVTIIEKLYTNTAEIQNYIICGAVVVCALIIRYILDKLSAKMSFLASANVKKVFREKIYNKLLQLGTSYKEKVSTSSVVQMAAEGVDQLETYFGNYLPQLIYSLLAPVTLFILLSFVNLKAAVILLVCVPLIPVSIVLVQKIAKGLLSKYWGSYTELGDSFLEKLQGLTTLKIYSADDRAADELDKESEHFRKITMKVLTMQLNSTSVMDIMAYGGAAIGIMFALLEFANGNTGLGGTLLIILLASEFFIPLRKLGSFFHIAMNGMAASDKIFALLDTEQPQNAGKKINGTVESITVSNLNYAYTADRKILNNINMEVNGKGLVSVVGTSGSGKSTLAAILMGRNKNYAGSIQINGTELSEIDEREHMNRITFVSGDSHIFKGTIRDNLLLGDRNATDSQMYNALSVAKLDDFVKNVVD
ncbi:MAG: ABC transporter transmembrane domain-containing protein [Oscillospiraceae bacterium]|nr:ABC transporter transmembrane domain-containing protein [Oscillospiraceae bacterium]